MSGARALKWMLGLASVAIVVATLSPLVRDPIDDGYPLSTYPMFASRRPTVLTVDYAYGVGRDGARVPIEPAYVGSKEVLQARAILERGVHGGPAAANALCAEIAGRIAAAAVEGVTEVHLVTGTHDAVEYLVRGKMGKEITRAVCKVARVGPREGST